MLKTARVSAFTVSELLRGNLRLGDKNTSPPRLELNPLKNLRKIFLLINCYTGCFTKKSKKQFCCVVVHITFWILSHKQITIFTRDMDLSNPRLDFYTRFLYKVYIMLVVKLYLQRDSTKSAAYISVEKICGFLYLLDKKNVFFVVFDQ